jgi:hypothetical protein
LPTPDLNINFALKDFNLASLDLNLNDLNREDINIEPGRSISMTAHSILGQQCLTAIAETL